MTFDLTNPEKRRRVEQSIKETQRKLDKELSYAEDLQYPETIADYQAHIARLSAALEAGVLESNF